MNIEALRAKALAYSPEMTYAIVLDQELRAAVIAAQRAVLEAEAKRDEIFDELEIDPEKFHAEQDLDQPHMTMQVERKLEEAKAAADAAVKAAEPETVVLNFRRLHPDDYQGFLEKHTDDKGKLHVIEMSDDLLATCYLRTTSADRQDLGLSWDEARTIGDHGDRDQLRDRIINHHRQGGGVSFDMRSFGRPATS